jgi:DNA-binding transcriptional LysR family regulator
MNVKNFDLNLLRVFAAVDVERNVSKAAARIGLSQPAMSNALARLRTAFDDPLFVRTTTGMEPTALAVQMATGVHDTLSRFERVIGGPSDFDPQRVNRRFRLLMTDAGQLVVLPALMKALSNTARGIAIEVVEIPRERFIESLQSGFADLAISHLTSSRAGIHEEALFDDTYCCVAATRHPSLCGKISLQQFVKAKHVTITSGNAETHVDRVLSKKRLGREVALTVTQYHIAIEAVRATSLIATVPLRSVQPTHDVQVLELPFEVPVAQIRQFWDRRVHTDPANQWLRNFLKTSLEDRKQPGAVGVE